MEQTDYAYAARFRDIVRRIADSRIQALRPRPQLATVVSVDPALRQAMVTFPCEFDPVPVGVGAIVPAEDSVVLVDGPPDDRYIIDVPVGPWTPSDNWTFPADTIINITNLPPSVTAPPIRYCTCFVQAGDPAAVAQTGDLWQPL